jgi:hypothetical protein
MKVTWEEKDILVGRYITYPSDSGKLCTSRTFKIGYYPNAEEDGTCRYCLIAITDGMICRAKTKAELAASLTNQGAVPISTDHLVEMVKMLYRMNEGIESITYTT